MSSKDDLITFQEELLDIFNRLRSSPKDSDLVLDAKDTVCYPKSYLYFLTLR